MPTSELPSPGSFRALVGAQFFGAFNDNLFKQLILFLAAGFLFPGEDKQGLAFAFFALPFVLFSGIAGDLSERFSKRRVIVAMKLAEIGIMILGAAALQSMHWGFMLAVLCVMGAQSAIFGPSKYGVIPELVPVSRLLSANGTIAMTTFLAVLLGQALAGPLLDGFGDALWVPGAFCTLFAVVGTVFALRIARVPPMRADLSIGLSPFGRLFGTIARLRGQGGIFSVVILYSLFWFDGGVIQQAIVALGEPAYLDIGAGEKKLLSFVMVTLAVGIIVGSVLAPRLSKVMSAGRMVFVGGTLMVLGQIALLSIGTLFVRSNGGLWVAHALAAWIGVSGAFFVVPVQSYLQDAPPPGMRGQTFAVNNFMNFLFIFLGGVYYLAARMEPVDIGPTVAQALAGLVVLAWMARHRWQIRAITIGQASRATADPPTPAD